MQSPIGGWMLRKTGVRTAEPEIFAKVLNNIEVMIRS